MPSPNYVARLTVSERTRLAIKALEKDQPQVVLRHAGYGASLHATRSWDDGPRCSRAPCSSLLEAAASLDSIKCFNALLAAGTPLTCRAIDNAFDAKKGRQCNVLRSLFASGEIDPSSVSWGLRRARASSNARAVDAVREALAAREMEEIASALPQPAAAPQRASRI